MSGGEKRMAYRATGCDFVIACDASGRLTGIQQKIIGKKRECNLASVAHESSVNNIDENCRCINLHYDRLFFSR